VSCCQVFTLARLYIDSNLRDTLRNGDACSPSPNVEMFKLHLMMHDNIKNVDDYFVVMAYGNHIVFDTFACLD
jgi:hypothetical protein